MRALARALPWALASVLLLPAVAGASGFGVFQHGGRATAQAGAWTARADDPSAVTYNPAAIAWLDGWQLQAGLDFSTPKDTYRSASGGFTAQHDINFPPALYLTWKPDRNRPYAFGLGFDSPYWYRKNWFPREFPGRFLGRIDEAELWEVHPVAAWKLDDHWSVGGGLRWVFGSLQAGTNALVRDTSGATREDEVLADAHGTGWAFDLSANYRETIWGFGAELRSAAKVSGTADVAATRRDSTLTLPVGVGQATTPLAGFRKQSFELAPEARVGAWLAPYPELRFELDLAYAAWSRTGNRSSYFAGGLAGATLVTRDRNWQDTLSLRFGVEGNLNDALMLSGGIALEPSPVPSDTLDPGFPRGDAVVYALGGSYTVGGVSFDAGYSFHQHSGRSASGQELLQPGASGRYTANDQVFSLSARWKF